jgi:hypothetical protein
VDESLKLMEEIEEIKKKKSVLEVRSQWIFFSKD